MSQWGWPEQPQRPPPGEGGVYHAVKPRIRVDERELYVPRFLSPAFFRFLVQFISSPTDNAMFLREWRCSRRRLHLEGYGGVGVAVALSVAAAITLIGLGVAVGLGGSSFIQEMVVHGVYLLPSVLAGVFGFFFSIQGGGSLSDRRMLDELALTPLKPQEIVFGYLTGGILPYTLLLLPYLPGAFFFATVAAFSEELSMNFSLLHGFMMVGMMYPNVAASILMTSAIAMGVSYGGKNRWLAMAEGLAAWAVVLAMMGYLGFLARLTTMNPMGFSVLSAVAMPFVVVLKLSVAGGFLHHTAVRLAHQQAAELEQPE